MPQFATPEEFVAFRCTCERVDEGGVTTYQVVDRFRVGERIVGRYSDEAEARERLAEVRTQRVAEVKAQGTAHPAVHGGLR